MAKEKKQQSMIDPDNYHALNQAVEMAEAEKRLEAFWDDFYELRNKHKIPDVYVIFRIPVVGTGDIFTSHAAGCTLYNEPMTAWAFGREQSDRQHAIAALTKQGAVTRRKGE